MTRSRPRGRLRTELTADQTLELRRRSPASSDRPAGSDDDPQQASPDSGAPFAAAQHRASGWWMRRGRSANSRAGEDEATVSDGAAQGVPSRPSFPAPIRVVGPIQRHVREVIHRQRGLRDGPWRRRLLLLFVGRELHLVPHLRCRRASRSRCACRTLLPPRQQTVGASQMILPRSAVTSPTKNISRKAWS